MNPLCYVCDSLATRVCKSPSCSLLPFCCSGPCTKNISAQMHTHQNKQDFISYQQFQKKHSQIKNKLNPYITHQQHICEMKKKILLTKQHLQEQIFKLDKVLEKIERDIYENLSIQLIKSNQELMEKIETNMNGESINGGNISKLFQKEGLYANQNKVVFAVKQLGIKFQQRIDVILRLNVEMGFVTYEEIVKKSKILSDEGIVCKNNKDHKTALEKFRQASKINRSDGTTHLNIVECLIRLNKFNQQQEQSYQCCMRLLSNHTNTYLRIAKIYQQKKQFGVAYNWYTKALKIAPKNAQLLESRGHCSLQLNNYQQAIADYSAIQYQKRLINETAQNILSGGMLKKSIPSAVSKIIEMIKKETLNKYINEMEEKRPVYAHPNRSNRM